MENIEEAKRKVEDTKQSWRSIAKEHGTNHVSLKKFAENNGWDISHRVSKNISKSGEVSQPHKKILGKTAIRKMTEIKEELGDKYSPVDEPLIIMVARSFEEYIELGRAVIVEGYVLESPKTGGKYLNPTFNAYQAVQKNLITVANQLGLSIASRKKLGLKFERPGMKETSIFDIVAEIDSNDGEFDIDDI